MTERPYVDPGHKLSDEDWANVTARAKEIREEIKANAQGGASSGIVPVNDMTAAGIASKKYFAESGIPTQLLVLHSGECPLQGGYARSLTLWAATVYPQSPIASWTWFIDPLEMVAFIPPNLGAWHASEANVLSEGFEQAGYARYTRAEWLTPDGLIQLESLAFYMAQRAVANGIPARWLTDAEVTAATNGDRSIKGLCFHRQIDPETRTDPGNGYPADLLLERIRYYMTGTVLVESLTTGDEDMGMVIASDSGVNDGKVWIGNGMFRRHIPDPGTLDAIWTMREAGRFKHIENEGRTVENWPQEALGMSLADVIPQEVNRVTQNLVNGGISYALIPEIRGHTAEQADRVLQAIASIPNVSGDLVAQIREQVLAAGKEGAEAIRSELDSIEITLKSDRDQAAQEAAK